jgi:hypothetical protein
MQRSPQPSDTAFRRVRDSDYPALLALQEANLRDNLPVEARAEGFLSARFTREQFAEMDTGGAVVVAQAEDAIAGYLCASTVDFNRRFALLAAMIERYPQLALHGRPLTSFTSFVYGPVCVDRAFRGRGMLRGLFHALLHETAVRFEIGVAFVAHDNAHSYAAHVQGLGMQDVGHFDFDGRRYRILAFLLRGE